MISQLIDPPVVKFDSWGTAKVALSFEYDEEFIHRNDFRTKESVEPFILEAITEFLQRQVKALNAYLANSGVKIQFDEVEDVDTTITDMEMY